MNGNEFEYFLDNLSLSTLLAKSSFAFLLLSMLFYWFQASFQSTRETEFAVFNSMHSDASLPQVSVQTNEFKKGNISWMSSLFGKAPSLTMGLANIALALMLLIRWVDSGHFPLSNLYESLLFLSWSLTSIHFFLERAFSKGGLLLPALGAITAPLALFTNAFATFSLPQEMQKVSVLVPALQSNWLIMHVSVMMVSYAALLSGSLLAMAFLVVKFFSDTLSVKNAEELAHNQDDQSSPYHSISQVADLHLRSTSCYTSLEEIVQDDRSTFFQMEDFRPKGYNVSTSFSSPGVKNPPNESRDKKLPSCAEQEGGPALSLSAKLASSLHPNSNLMHSVNPVNVQTSELELKPSAVSYTSTYTEGVRDTPKVYVHCGPHQVKYSSKMDNHDGQNLRIKNTGFNIPKSEETFEEKLKQILDNLSYRSIGLGFALLTIGIFSGAVWANEAWGSYWSWDPKETWAFITWLIFALYLHTRLSRGWVGKESALVATFGFLVIWFCYLGVNLFGKGLHSYGWFPAN